MKNIPTSPTRDAIRDSAGVFYKPMDAQEKAHCRLDLHKVLASPGHIAMHEFVTKWGARIDVLLAP